MIRQSAPIIGFNMLLAAFLGHKHYSSWIAGIVVALILGACLCLLFKIVERFTTKKKVSSYPSKWDVAFIISIIVLGALGQCWWIWENIIQRNL